MNIDGLMWAALEGALGPEKTAYLKNAPLSELTGAPTLPEAVAEHSMSRQEKRAFYRDMQTAFSALNEVAPNAVAPEMSFTRKLAAAEKARILEQATSGEVTVKVAELRRELDRDIFDTFVKRANLLAGVSESPAGRTLSKRLSKAEEIPNIVAEPLPDDETLQKKATSLLGNLGGGLALGTGLAVPLYVGGTLLGQEQAENMRDKALQAALGAGLIGVGAYGAGRGIDYLATEQERDRQAARSVDMQRAMLANTLAANQAMKYSAHAPSHTDLTEPSPVLKDSKGDGWPSKKKEKAPGGEVKMEQEEGKVAHLVTAVYIDQFLAQVDQTEKVAELREINCDYGVTLICELERV